MISLNENDLTIIKYKEISFNYKGNMEGLAVVPVVLAVVDCASKGLHVQKNYLFKFKPYN